jgi:exodeoxyribonuclease VIII
MAYADIDAVNWSTLQVMDRSPKHYRHRTETPRADTPAMLFGRCVHRAILEPDTLADHVVTYGGTTRRGNAWDAFRAEHEGKEILTAKERDAVAAVSDAVLAHPIAAEVLARAGEREAVRAWVDGETGIMCKCRADLLTDEGQIVEVKTARDVDPWAFARAVASYRYHGQVAFYADGAGLPGAPAPVIIAVEKDPPYDVVVFDCAEVVDAGRRLYRRLLDRLAVCLESGVWPGMGAEVVRLELPAWADDGEADADWSEIETRPAKE